ncbi:MAG: RluA family pseudouridine synthase [Acetobacteraceae bacterium]|nr:RluA family pseudouridine synthase [Acetobacteraceae bacterium]MBV8525826.1 RluA family pseudouridine synthase [Acetobacteraceae bacterium]
MSRPPAELARCRNSPTCAARPEQPPEQRSFAVHATARAAGQRTDRFLADFIGVLSRSRVKALILDGHVTCDGQVIRDPAGSVQAGAHYVVDVPPPMPATPQPEAIPFTILFEDADLIVLDKPAGLVVHPAPGNPRGTLVNALLAHCGETLPGIGGERRPGIVHRLDKDTSGVMVIAKTEFALAALTAAFGARDLDRAYDALCWGVPCPASGEIERAIGRDPRDRKRMAVVAKGGRPALTRYSIKQSWFAHTSLLECRLTTGRTHQIRVHLSQIGHPLVGDPVYLRRRPAASKLMPEPARTALLDFPRQALHAGTLGFNHPRTGRPMAFTAPIPEDMAGLITTLQTQTVPG